MAALWTLLAVVILGRSSWWTPANWALLAAVYWILGSVGLAVIKLRPDLAARPRRPSTAPATMCVVAACLAAVGGVVALEVLVTDRTGLGLACFAVGVAVCAGLGLLAHRLNDRAEASGRFSLAVGTGQPA